MRAMTVGVFVGPTLSVGRIRDVLGQAVCLGPAGRGDVYLACRQKPRALAILDGYFDHRLALWHKEILWALAQGIAVYGGGSMGALRAVELASFGMIGVGRIFEWFRDGVLEDDDEVAVVHAPSDQGYAVFSDALVNIRATVERALGESIVSGATGERLVAAAKAISYRDRSYARTVQAVREQGLDDGDRRELERFEHWLDQPGAKVDQKRDDALAVLERIRADLREPEEPRPAPAFHFEHTEAWQELVRTLRTA